MQELNFNTQSFINNLGSIISELQGVSTIELQNDTNQAKNWLEVLLPYKEKLEKNKELFMERDYQRLLFGLDININRMQQILSTKKSNFNTQSFINNLGSIISELQGVSTIELQNDTNQAKNWLEVLLPYKEKLEKNKELFMEHDYKRLLFGLDVNINRMQQILSKYMYDAFKRVYDYSKQNENQISPGQKLNEDRESLIQRMRNDGYSEEEISVVTSISNEELAMAAIVVVDKAIAKGVTKSDKQSFYHVAGQPGCGKSAAIKAIENSLEGVPFASEMDVYRTKHPRIAQIKEIIAKKYPDDLEKQGKEFVVFTSFFADVLELTVISYMISEGYSVIKETTGKNSKGICGMIEALKSQYPQMTASIACMAVAQEVSIDGTLTRGATMNNLTSIFVEDLKKAGIETKPVGRGNVPRSFSEDTCSKIPDSMARIADSGLVDGEFLIVKRGKEDSVVARISGAECKANSDYIRVTLADRITGKKAKEEEKAHFDKKNVSKAAAEAEREKGNIEPFVELYLYPTRTWLKETDKALDFYSEKSGIVELDPEKKLDKVARWLVENKMLPQFLSEAQSHIGLSDSREFDVENAKANDALNNAGQRLGNVVIGMSNPENVDELASVSKK